MHLIEKEGLCSMNLFLFPQDPQELTKGSREPLANLHKEEFMFYAYMMLVCEMDRPEHLTNEEDLY